MCIAIVESLKFDANISVVKASDHKPRVKALGAKELVFSIVHSNEKWHGGRIRWGYPTNWNGKKKWLRHATAERRFGYWADWKMTIIPVRSFIERDTVEKNTLFVEFQALTPFWLGGLWSRDESGTSSLVMVTKASTPDVAAFHHRMPLIMNFEEAQQWLRSGESPQKTISLSAFPRNKF